MKDSGTLKESLGNFLRCLGDLIVLNWLWFLCSLPIVTIGPATCALYSITLKLVREEPAETIKDFFRAFRENFKRGLLLELMAAILLIVAGTDALFALSQQGTAKTVFLVVATMVALVFLTFTAYVFPLQAMFQNSVKGHIRNGFSLAFVSPGKTILLWVNLLLPVAAPLLLPRVLIATIGFVYLIAGFSGPAYFNSRILKEVFQKVGAIPAPPQSNKED